MKNFELNTIKANYQTLLIDGNKYLLSYDTAIVKISPDGTITLDSHYWDYSNTTGKHRNDFLGEKKKDTQKNIDAGIYLLGELN